MLTFSPLYLTSQLGPKAFSICFLCPSLAYPPLIIFHDVTLITGQFLRSAIQLCHNYKTLLTARQASHVRRIIHALHLPIYFS